MDKIKKLKLKKEIIASLNNVEMGNIKGGTNSYDCASNGCNVVPPLSKVCNERTTVPTSYCGGINTSATCPPTASVSCLPTDPYW